MQIKLSEKQEAVVSHRNKNMLVSAAAGSGKTAVLVKRIISLITDEKDPTDLDRMLIVTFTKAAAGEMKERIRKELDEIIAKGDADEHIRSQSVLIHNARISTIHSFCSQIIKSYFYQIDVDPSFRTVEDAERSLMMNDCAKEALKSAFDSEDKDILDFAAAYSTGKSSGRIIEYIIKAYDKLSAQAWPDVWMDNALKWWDTDSADELLKTPEMRGIVEKTVDELEFFKARAEKNLEIALSPGGPSKYVKIMESDVKILDTLAKAEDYLELKELFESALFEELPRGKAPEGEDKQLRGRLGASHNEIKNAVKKIKEDYFSADIDGILSENRICRRHIRAFFRLLKEFSVLYAEKKRAKNLMDFNDLEHFALKILLKRNADGSIERTEAAKEIAAGIDYVMTDEYQDSNDIQEYILSAVSGNEDGINNRFMVGDIKQAIYGFRNASPEIFMKKYSEYKCGDGGSEAIDLHDNYRSSKEVIDTLNFLFERVMSRRLGGVEYDDDQALHKGERPDKKRKVSDRTTEILLLDEKEEGSEESDLNSGKDEAEAVLIASEIRKLMTVSDGSVPENALKYSDIAVLVRTGAQAERFSRILQKEGVPAYAQSKSGYFDTTEVALMLNYIRVLDNPLQDIPLASVLFSPITGCTAEELAKIKINKKDGRFYEAVLEYAASGEDKKLAEKLKAFFELYNELLEMSRYMSVSELINEIYTRTGYRSYAAAMPGGSRRAANLDMLLQRASAYEKTSYSGLFNFIRYIEELKKDEEDMGEANLFSEKSDAVSIMTIHKSKGLEYPVVFLSGCARQTKSKGASEAMLIHKEMGIGIDAVDFEAGKKKTTVYKNLIKDALTEESKSEELRVLYVALTRAKEKLYITAVTDLEKLIKKVLEQKESGLAKLNYRTVYNSNSFIEIILNAFSDHKMFEPAVHWAGRYDEKFSFDGDYIKCRVISAAELERQKDIYGNMLVENLDMLPKAGNTKIFDEGMHKLLKEIDAYRYPYEMNESIPAKASVSDIKRMHLFSSDEQTGFEAEKEEEIIPYIPAFIAEKQEESTGAARGTAYHKFWKFFDYGKLTECAGGGLYEAVKQMAEELQEKNLLSRDEFNSIYISDFVRFAGSPLGKRMAEAFKAGKLVREQPFTALMPPESVDPSWKDGEDIIIQGVIDAYFEEDGGYVLVDYKTDYVSDGTGDELIKKYRAQLEIYADVLEKDKKHVKEKIIYSTHLQKCVML
jgi:ATP-dependent helicase/nuclease subunit A